MIMKFTSSSYEYAGRVNDEIWISSGLRGIARRRIRPATRATKLEYRALFSLSLARVAWENLGSSTQTEWNELAESTFGWPLQGSPRYMDGETFFANYYTVLLTLDEYADVPDPPEEGPDWQTKPKFFEFAEWEYDIYNLKAETEFEVDTVLLFSGLPPSRSGFKPDFAREVFIGNDVLYGGLYGNDLYDGVHYMMENYFGTITEAQKIWGRIWEVYPETGYVRTLKDPCTPDPTDVDAGNTLVCEIYNDYDDILQSIVINLMDFSDPPQAIGYGDAYDLPYQETATFTITLAYDLTMDQVQFVGNEHYWENGDGYIEDIVFDGNDPFQLSAYPNHFPP